MFAVLTANSTLAATFSVSDSVGENASTQSSWLASLNEPGGMVDNFQGFETGFFDAQNLNTAVIGTGLTLREGSGQVVVDQGPGAIGGSNPIGDFALESSEGAGTRAILEFATPVDYVSFFFIDLLSMDVVINTQSGSFTQAAGPNDFNGDSAEFFGYFSDNAAGDRVTSVFFNDVTGTNGWALDNIAWGNTVAPVPVPAGLPLLIGGLFALTLLKRSRRS